jgi:hypothetical protein
MREVNAETAPLAASGKLAAIDEDKNPDTARRVTLTRAQRVKSYSSLAWPTALI